MAEEDVAAAGGRNARGPHRATTRVPSLRRLRYPIIRATSEAAPGEQGSDAPGTRGPNAGQRARAVCQAPGLQRWEKTPAALQSPGRTGAGGSHRGAWRHRHLHALEVCILAFPGRPRHHGGGSQLGSGVGGRPRGPHGRRQDGTEPAPRGDGRGVLTRSGAQPWRGAGPAAEGGRGDADSHCVSGSQPGGPGAAGTAAFPTPNTRLRGATPLGPSRGFLPHFSTPRSEA